MTRRASSTRFVDDYLAYLLARASAVVSGHFHRQIRQAGLTVAEWRALAALADGAPVSVTELAGIVLMKQPTVTKLIGRLETQGLVSRAENPDDRRQTLVQLTVGGAGRIGALLPRAKAHETSVLAPLQAADIDRLKRQLRALIALGEGPPAALGVRGGRGSAGRARASSGTPAPARPSRPACRRAA